MVHGRQARCADIANPTDLNRGGFAGKNAQPVTAGMAAHIKKNIDLIPFDFLRQFSVT